MKHNISSSIWSLAKNSYTLIMDISAWIIGNGIQINFWLNFWCGPPLSQTLNHFVFDFVLLNKKVSDFIVNKIWELPLNIRLTFPNLFSIISTRHIPGGDLEDKRAWLPIEPSCLAFKEAYNFISKHSTKVSWHKQVRNSNIRPSKFLLCWRCIQNKPSTN